MLDWLVLYVGRALWILQHLFYWGKSLVAHPIWGFRKPGGFSAASWHLRVLRHLPPIRIFSRIRVSDLARMRAIRAKKSATSAVLPASTDSPPVREPHQAPGLPSSPIVQLWLLTRPVPPGSPSLPRAPPALAASRARSALSDALERLCRDPFKIARPSHRCVARSVWTLAGCGDRSVDDSSAAPPVPDERWFRVLHFQRADFRTDLRSLGVCGLLAVDWVLRSSGTSLRAPAASTKPGPQASPGYPDNFALVVLRFFRILLAALQAGLLDVLLFQACSTTAGSRATGQVRTAAQDTGDRSGRTDDRAGGGAGGSRDEAANPSQGGPPSRSHVTDLYASLLARTPGMPQYSEASLQLADTVLRPMLGQLVSGFFDFVRSHTGYSVLFYRQLELAYFEGYPWTWARRRPWRLLPLAPPPLRPILQAAPDVASVVHRYNTRALSSHGVIDVLTAYPWAFGKWAGPTPQPDWIVDHPDCWGHP